MRHCKGIIFLPKPFLPDFHTLRRFLVKQLSFRCTTTLIAQSNHFNFFFIAALAKFQTWYRTSGFTHFGTLTVVMDFAPSIIAFAMLRVHKRAAQSHLSKHYLVIFSHNSSYFSTFAYDEPMTRQKIGLISWKTTSTHSPFPPWQNPAYLRVKLSNSNSLMELTRTCERSALSIEIQ